MRTDAPSPNKRKTVALMLATAAVSLGVAGVLAEIVLRLVPIPGIGYHTFFYNETTGGRYYPHTTVIYRNARGDDVRRRVNAWGFLDVDHAPAKPPGTARIGFFGDSYTEAQQVPLDSTFFRRVERRLNKRDASQRYECFSFGVSGYSTLQSYLEYRTWADSLDLDWVVYVFVENDPGDQIRAIKRSEEIPLAVLSGDTFAVDNAFRGRYGYKTSAPHRAVQFLKSHSLVLSTLDSRLKLLKKRGVKLRVTREDMQMAEGADQGGIPRSGAPPSQWPDSLLGYTAEVGTRVLGRWIRDVHEAGRRFTVLYIPREPEMGRPYGEQDSWAAWLAEVCQAHGVAMIDPSARFSAAIARGEEVFYDHLTPRGHAELATAFLDYPHDGVAWPLAFEPIASPAGNATGEPNLFAAEDGRVYMSWVKSTGRGASLRLAVRRDGGWSPPRTVASGSDWFVNWADFPSVVAWNDGRLAAHWLAKSATATFAYDVRVARSRDGGRTWTEPSAPHTDGTATEHGFVSMLPWDDGRVFLIWLDGRNFAAGTAADRPTQAMTLRSAFMDDAGRLSDERRLDDRVCDCCQTSAVRTPHGALVAYRDRSEAEVRDIRVIRFDGGRWGEPAAVYNDGWKIPGCPVNGPALAASGPRVAIAWFTNASDAARVKLAFSSDEGKSFERPVVVDDGDPMGRVDVVMLEDGSALVSWMEFAKGSADIRLRRILPDGSRSDSLVLAASSGERSSGFPRMVRAGDTVYIAWTVPGEPSLIKTAAAGIR